MGDTLYRELIAYLKLARAFQNQSQYPDRDRALVLAGTCASLLNWEKLAQICRQRILQNNRGHMLHKWSNLAEALQEPDFQVFLKQLSRRFPLEKAESLICELRADPVWQRADFKDDLAYAAALLGLDAESWDDD